MFVPNFLFFELFSVGFLVDAFKSILEAAVVLLEDSVLGGQVEGVVSL